MVKPLVVGITGGSGSGKTLFMKKLVSRLTRASLLSMDHYYLEITKQQKDSKGIENFDRLESIDHHKYIKDLKKLINGESISYKEYTFNNKSIESKTVSVKSQPIILVEGIFILYIEKIRNLIDLSLYIEAPDYLMMKRRIIRDINERGYNLNDVLYRYEHHVTPSFEEYIEPSKKWANFIIPNYKNFDIALKMISVLLDEKCMNWRNDPQVI